MEAKELRLLNWVQFEHNGSIKQRQVAELSLEESNKFEPIPLTEEWLLKFGFDGDQQEGWESTCGKCVYLQDWRDNDCRHVSNRGCCVMQIKYVNQLQNLYFALTGEELTIKE